jgi:hypothetical protein
MNSDNLTNKQSRLLEEIKMKNQNLKTMRAYQMSFQEFYDQPAELAV